MRKPLTRRTVLAANAALTSAGCLTPGGIMASRPGAYPDAIDAVDGRTVRLRLRPLPKLPYAPGKGTAVFERAVSS